MATTRVRDRLAPSIFRLPVERIREGYYSDAYFVHTKELLERENLHPRVLMQVFQRQDSLLGGVDEAIAVLKQGAGCHGPDGSWVKGWPELEVHALYEGDRISPRETVMTIEGDYTLFAQLETVYLGCLARRSLVMRNVREVVEAAGGKDIFYFPARHDHWLVQTGDGWAAHVAGAIGVSTDAQASWWGGRGIGTVPHGLIAAFQGDTVKAAVKFADAYAEDMNVTVLVDFDNDSVRTALEVAEAHAPEVVAERIREFEAAGVPVDAYGVGSSLIRGQNDYTADVVMVDGRPMAKAGRRFEPNPRLELVT
jgi:nicotinate phosphoribosyltransferase